MPSDEPTDALPSPGDRLSNLIEAVDRSHARLTPDDRLACVGSELESIDRVLSQIRIDDLARGQVFCEWGSGLGGVCGVASLNGFTTLGIEIEQRLVHSARALAHELDLTMVFTEGTFLLPGDEDLAPLGDSHTRLAYGTRAWDEIRLLPADCDVIFAYPWPGEESFVEGVFSRHASADSLLITFHDFDRVLVQRKLAGSPELMPLGWM